MSPMGGLLARGGLTGWHRVAPGVQVYSGWGKGLRGAAGVHGGAGSGEVGAHLLTLLAVSSLPCTFSLASVSSNHLHFGGEHAEAWQGF